MVLQLADKTTRPAPTTDANSVGFSRRVLSCAVDESQVMVDSRLDLTMTLAIGEKTLPSAISGSS